MSKQSIYTNSPIAERSEEFSDYDYEDAASGGGCGCFHRLSWWRIGADESHNHLLRGSGGLHKERWLVLKFKEVKEFSEVVMGPKWKNLVRKLGKVWNGKKETTTQFQYSPESYALNFAGGDGEEDGELMHSFSTRFAAAGGGGGLGNDHQRRTAL